MIDFLIQHTIKDANNTKDPRVRNAYGRLGSIVGIVCNVLLCTAKALVGIAVGSISIVADAINNLSDASSNIISLIGFKLASKPADKEHPFGHGRIEYMAGVLVSVLVAYLGIELIRTSITKIQNPEPLEFSFTIIVVLVGSMLVKLWMMYFNRTLGMRIDSLTLEATAVDSRNDVITTGAVLAATLFSVFTGINIDGWAGLVVGAFIVASGVKLIKETLNPLLGQTPDPALVRHIHDTIMSYPGVLGTHDLMVHDYGPGRTFVSAHVEMAAEVSPLISHDTIDNIERDFLEKDNLHVVLHYDPIITNDPQVCDVRHWISQAITTIDPNLTIHDLRCVPGVTHTNVIFDCLRPDTLPQSITDEELKEKIAALVRTHYPTYNCVITVDDSYVTTS